jgi:TolB-like protein/Flp pilus assembly protein TadD
MSPEQVRGQTSDNRSDLWALGVLLYTMLAGRPPFVGETAEAVCYQILNDSPKPPSALRSGVSSELDYVVLKLLRKDPAMRYGRAEDLVADLTSLMGPASAPAEPQPSTPRLAVVPFEVMGADSDDVFLAQGLAEDLIVDLTRLGGLRVASRAEVAPYRERSVPPRTLARELGADYVLLGSVRRAGNRARISAQLVRASDGNTTWADRFDRTLDDLFEVQAEVSKHIVEALQVTLRADEREMLDRAPSHDVAAYALYLQARELIDVTSETNREAERLLQKALALDERFPLALAALGETYAIRGMRWWASPDEAARLARPFAERALALEPDLVDAHLVLARVHRLTGDTEAFTAAIERVLATDPDHQEAVEYAAWCYLSRGTPGRALPLLERAAERDRASYRGLTFLENAYEMLHRVEDAERTALRANEARLEHVRRHPGREGAHARSQVAVRLMVVGQMEEGKRQMRLALAADPDDGRLHYNAACAYARAGLHEEAIAELRAGVQGLTSFLGDWPLHDPDLESVREHPEFVRLFGRVGPGG